MISIRIPKEIIENAPNIFLLIEKGILTIEEVREMLGLEPKTEIEVNGIKYKKDK